MNEPEKTYEVEIQNTAYGGTGICRINGMAVFVRGAVPGERLRVICGKVKRKYALAEVVEVLRASPDRIEPDCEYCFRSVKPGTWNFFCAGCSYRHMNYEREVFEKNRQFSEMLGRVAGPDVKNRIMSPVSSPLSDGYRNKAVLHAQTERGCTVLGYFTENNTDVIDIDRCLLADEAINAELESRRRESGFFETLRDGMSVTFRHTSGDGVLMWRNKPPRNLSWLKENTCLGTFSFPADSFFQVNPKAQNLVISRALDFIKRDNPDNVLDLYCGCGIFTVAAALKVKCRAFGADCDPGSIEAAVYNAGKFGLDNCSFKALPAEKIVKTSCMDMPPGRNMLIVDPPRSGVSVNALRVLTGAGFDSIIYISCAPDTLCRDIKYFLEAGYEIFGSGIADMFPRTFHFESVTYLKRVK